MTRTPWTAEQLDTLRRLYAMTPTIQIAELIDQMLAYGRDCERAANERAAQQCEIVRHNSPLDLTYQEGCTDRANAIRALGGADK